MCIRDRAYIKESTVWEEAANDFAFETYGEYSGNEPDGIVDRWAVVVGTRSKPDDDAAPYFENNANDVDELLSANNWTTNLLIDVTKYSVINALLWMRDQEDADDVVLFYFSGHGGSYDSDGDGVVDKVGLSLSLIHISEPTRPY